MKKSKIFLLPILIFIILIIKMEGKSIRQTMIESSFPGKEYEKILFSSLDFEGKKQKKEVKIADTQKKIPPRTEKNKPKKPRGRFKLSKVIMNRIDKYDKIIDKYSKMNNLNKAFVKAVIYAESAGNYKAVSSKGAMGLMQLMPKTAASLNVKKPFNPSQNIKGGTKLLSMLKKYYKDDDFYMLWAYNAGITRVKNGFLPTETKNYIIKIKRLQNLINKEERKNEQL